MIDSILFSVARVTSFIGGQPLSNATGFFFCRTRRLYLVTSRHVMIDAANRHFPDRLELEIHTNPQNLADSTGFSIPLYQGGKSLWRQGRDNGGEVDVAVIEIDRAALPMTQPLFAFGPEHLPGAADQIEIGSPVLIAGFPLGFHDTLHHIPVVRQAVIASSFGLRFQGQGYFLTDARTHRGSSGAPVIMRRAGSTDPLPWFLLGVHAARLDVVGRDMQHDEALGLNCAWYADILLSLTS